MAKTLLQEAIAEAKQVREAALRNATKQLEENLTPSIKEALAQKLEEEVELDENEEESLEEATNAGFTEVKPKKQVKEAEEEPKDDEEEKSEEGSEEEPEGKEGSEESEEEPEDKKPEGEEEPEGKEEGSEDDDKKLSDITIGELKDIIQDVVAAAAVPAPEGNEGADMTPGDVEGTGEEASLGDLEATAGAEAAGEEGAEEPEETPAGEEDVDDDEEIDLSEILKELEGEKDLQEEDTAGTLKDPKSQAARRPGNTQSRQNQNDTELDEAYRTIRQLKDTLSEVNLLNSKLLYTTRMLKGRLTESQKVEVVSAFDKAKSPKEVKVIYRTLVESMKPARKDTLSESRRSFASRSAGRSTAGQSIVESSEMVRRFQQLAGIID